MKDGPERLEEPKEHREPQGLDRRRRPTVRESLRYLLERRGLSKVGAASDGAEAVSMACSTPTSPKALSTTSG
jgi:hypothetical protein